MSSESMVAPTDADGKLRVGKILPKRLAAEWDADGVSCPVCGSSITSCGPLGSIGGAWEYRTACRNCFHYDCFLSTEARKKKS